LPDEWKEALDRPITSEELEGAMSKGEVIRHPEQMV
jgi:hypothetical protein